MKWIKMDVMHPMYSGLYLVCLNDGFKTYRIMAYNKEKNFWADNNNIFESDNIYAYLQLPKLD